MLNRLATVGSGVDDGAISIRELQGARQFRHCSEHATEQRVVCFDCLRERNNVAARDDKYMHRCLRISIGECNNLVVFKKQLGRNLPACDVAENTIHIEKLIARTSVDARAPTDYRRARTWRDQE